MRILAIESSCDETAVAVVEDTTDGCVREVSSSIASSKELHDITGGIVPEIAARKQVESILPVLDDVIGKYKKTLSVSPGYFNDKFLAEYIDAIAVTVGPGLIGSLIVGIEAAKSLSMSLGKPLIPVNHLIGHIYANFLGIQNIKFPFIGLVVSGGHTDIIFARDHYDLEYIGGTLDDAAGEAFDKAARMMGISMYMGGAQLSAIASTCVDDIYKGQLPRPMLEKEGFDMSFSGLKTSVKRFIEKIPDSELDNKCLAKEFENAVVDVLVDKTMSAVEKYKVKTLLLGGGVSANKKLRDTFRNKCQEESVSLFYPEPGMCGDNAVYIGVAAYFLQKSRGLAAFMDTDYSKIVPEPSLGVMDY